MLVTLSALRSPAQLLQVDQHADAYGNGFYSVTTNAPIGQTFTPTTNALGFAQLFMWEGGPAKLHLNLRSNGITGPLIATSRSVRIPASFKIPIMFDFAANVPVTAEQVYCLEPVLETGADCSFVYYHYSYPRGEGIVEGQPSTSIYTDMWFREGTVADFPRFTSEWERSNQFVGTVSGLTGQQLVIESSTDGFTWHQLQTNTFTSNTMSFSYSNASAPQTFYRALYVVP